MEIREGLTFDDVLLVPQYSEIPSRSFVDTSVELPKGLRFKHPIIPANMKSITEYDMAEQMFLSGGMALIHRFMDKERQLNIVRKLADKHGKTVWSHVGFSVGVQVEDTRTVDRFALQGAKILCVDVAHGDSKLCIDMCKRIHDIYPDILFIAGNVATGEGAKRLWEAGVDIVKVGVGSGSLCSTRIKTGNGVPQLTALMDVFEMRKHLTNPYMEPTPLMGENGFAVDHLWEKRDPKIKRSVSIISDGGVRSSGDCVKALCFADMVMTGSLFAGADETPSPTAIGGEKKYAGSSTHKTNHIEGVVAWVPPKGKTKDILEKLLEGIRSGCSYQGCNNLKELKENPQFIRITNAGLIESHPHIKTQV